MHYLYMHLATYSRANSSQCWLVDDVATCSLTSIPIPTSFINSIFKHLICLAPKMLRYVIKNLINKISPSNLARPPRCSYPRINIGHMVSVLAPLKGTNKQVGQINTQKPK